MNRTLIFLFAFSSISFFLFADIDEGIVSSEKVTEAAKESPVSLNGRYDFIFKSNFKKEKFKNDTIQFGEGGPDLVVAFAYNPTYCEGAYFKGGYISTFLDWNKNPFFKDTYFNRVTLNLGVFSKRFACWFWTAQIGTNIDTDLFNLWQYATYDLFLWGRRTITSTVNVHLGLIVQTGMKMDRFYPIIGFDWNFWKCFTLSAVYPVNFSLVYQMTNRWAFSLAARLISTRSRAGQKEPLPGAVWRYENAGIEADITYEIPSRGVRINVHGGWTLGGNLRIANRHNHHPKHFRFDSAGYVGAEASYKF